MKRWMQAEGLWVPARDKSRPATHLFLDGGKACVSLDATLRFYDKYARDILRDKSPQFLVEKISEPSFRMFLDVDLKVRHNVRTEDLVDGILGALPPALRVGRVVVCLRRSASTESKLSGGIGDPNDKAGGAHLVWQDLVLDSAEAARDLRDEVVRASGAPDDAVDASVYRSGLRMIFSLKPKDDSFYVPEYKVVFEDCGSLTKKTSYDFAALAGDAEARHALLVQALQDCSIRVEGGLRAESKKAKEASESFVSPKKKGLEDPNPRPAKRARKLANPPGPESQALEAVLWRAIPERYKPCRITKVTCGKDVIRALTDSRHCDNLGGPHKRNHVFFEFDRTGCYQRCFCKCDTTEGRKHGRCADFRGQVSGEASSSLSWVAFLAPSKAASLVPVLTLKQASRKAFAGK